MKQDSTAAPKVPARGDDVGALIEQIRPQIEKALPKHVTAERMARVALTAIRQNPKLATADKWSLIASVMVAAQLGLEPNTPLGHCYIIPYENRKIGKVQAQFQMGYKGVIDLASRAGVTVGAWSVDEADDFSYEIGLGKVPRHSPGDNPTGRVVKYWAQYMTSDGRTAVSVWTRGQVEAHAKRYSQAYRAGKQDSPWVTAFDAMAKKTVILDVLKYAPKSIEISGLSIAEATTLDGAALSIRPEDPDLAITPEWEEMPVEDTDSSAQQQEML